MPAALRRVARASREAVEALDALVRPRLAGHLTRTPVGWRLALAALAGLPDGAVKAALRLALVEVASADRRRERLARGAPRRRWPRCSRARTGARVRLPRGLVVERGRDALWVLRPEAPLELGGAPRPGAPSGGGDGRRDGRGGSASAGSAGRSGRGRSGSTPTRSASTRACPGRPRPASGSGRAGPGSAWCPSAEPTPCGSRSSWAAPASPGRRAPGGRSSPGRTRCSGSWASGEGPPRRSRRRPGRSLRLHAAPPRPPGLPHGDTV